MGFGLALGSFAQGLVGGMTAMARFEQLKADASYRRLPGEQMARQRAAAAEAKRRAAARTGGQGAIPAPQAVTTGGITGAPRSALPVPENRDGRTPIPGVVTDGGSNPSMATADAGYAAAGRAPDLDDDHLRGLYAAGGMVQRRGAYAAGGLVTSREGEEPELTGAVAPMIVEAERPPAAAIATPTAQPPPRPAARPRTALAVTPESNNPPLEPSVPFTAPANTGDPEMREPVKDPVRGALSYIREHFGLDQQGAAPAPGAIPDPNAAPAQAQNSTAAVAAITRGEGAASNEEVQQARQRVDPQNAMPLGRQNAILLEEMTNVFYEQGMIREGNEAAASLLQNFRRNMNMYGAFAVQAAENGNMSQAAQLLERAYDYMPDGNDVKVTPGRGGLQVQMFGPDGKPRGDATTLGDPTAVRNAVGYAMDFDNWAKHLLGERTVNENVRLREMDIGERSRHNRVMEGLQGASLAESRAARGEARARDRRDEDTFKAAQQADVDVSQAERALSRLAEDATPEQRQEATNALEEARTRAERLQANLGPRTAGSLSLIEGRRSTQELRRAEFDMKMQDRELRRQLAAETDPLKRREIESRINLNNRRAETAGMGRGRGAGGERSIGDKLKLDEAWRGVNVEGMTPEAVSEAQQIFDPLISTNPQLGIEQLGNLAAAARRGEVRFGEGPGGALYMGKGSLSARIPDEAVPLIQMWRRQAREGQPQREGQSIPGAIGSSAVRGLGVVGRGIATGAGMVGQGLRETGTATGDEEIMYGPNGEPIGTRPRVR